MSRRFLETQLALAAAIACLSGCNPSSVIAFNASGESSKGYIDAKTVLRQAVEDADPITRANAIEALAQVMGDQAGPIFKQALDDPDPTVRFAAAMSIGDSRYAPAQPVLVAKAKVGTGERDKRVYCAIIYALYRLGQTSYVSDMADLLQDPEPSVRANAAMVMGKIGDPSAVGPLKTMLANERDEGAKYSMYESLAILGDVSSQLLLESYAKGFYLDLRLAAIPAMAHQYSPRVVAVLRDLLAARNPPRVRAVAAGALAKLGEADSEGYGLCIAAVHDPNKVMQSDAGGDQVVTGMEAASLQRLAAIALGAMGRKGAVDDLQPLLTNPDGPVRVAAAMSMMRLLADRRTAAKDKRPEPPVGPPAKPADTAPASQPAQVSPSQPSTAPGPAARPAGKLKTSGAKD